MQAPLSALEASVTQVVVSVTGLIVGLGVLSPHDGGLVVSTAGIVIGGLIQIGNAIYALAHAKVASAIIAQPGTPSLAARALARDTAGVV